MSPIDLIGMISIQLSNDEFDDETHMCVLCGKRESRQQKRGKRNKRYKHTECDNEYNRVVAICNSVGGVSDQTPVAHFVVGLLFL